MVTTSILLSHQIQRKEGSKMKRTCIYKSNQSLLNVFEKTICVNSPLSDGCLLCSITGESRLLVSLVSLYKITAKDMKNGNTNSQCHSKRLTTNYQANRHLRRQYREWVTHWCCWRVRKTLFPVFFYINVSADEPQSSDWHSAQQKKSLLEHQLYQNHRISTNLFSSSVKITNEGVDKHSMEEKTFRIHSYSFLAATLLSGQIFSRWTFLQAKYIHRTRFIRHVSWMFNTIAVKQTGLQEGL